MKKVFSSHLKLLFLLTLLVNCSESEESLFTDGRDGQTYKTVQIGEQIWMAENLNYETSIGSWEFDNNFSDTENYGRLYDYQTADGVCPNGWHLPSDDEWKELEVAIGMDINDVNVSGFRGINEGSKLKARIGWIESGNGTDEYGFTVIATGYRTVDGTFENEGGFTYFWTSTGGERRTLHRLFHHSFEQIGRGSIRNEYGLPVRCIRD